MKKAVLCVVVIFIFVGHAQSKNSSTVYDQLCEINKEWVNNTTDFPILDETILFKSDQNLIQLHLSLVETVLRNKDVDHLSSAQKEKRNTGLDLLRTYWKRGVFPINLYHSERTPYFIDHLGTACAVGHILIETGYGNFAKQIRKENNYASIFELNKHYPLLNEWAVMHGFSLDELAWIQPSYGSCWSVNGSTTNPTCHGFSDGSVTLQIPVDGTPPYSISGASCFHLVAGTYTYTITDAVGKCLCTNPYASRSCSN